MKLGYELVIEQTQKLAMTQELIQAINILQYNNQELNEYIENEILENPLLEADEPGRAEREVNIEELREKIAESQEEMDTYKHWEAYRTEQEDFSFERYVAFRYSLTEHLLIQLHFSNLKGKDAEIGRYVIESIDDNGYLTLSDKEIAEAMDSDEKTVGEVISVVQTFDPPGIGARDLSECLAIQLEQTGELTDEYRALIFDKLSELAENKISLISKEMGLKPSDVQAMADRIKRLEPRPGRQYDPDQTVKYVIPDVYVEKVGDEYVVTDNESSTPHLMISSYYSKLTADEKDSGELKDYLNERLNSAMWLIKSIDQRKSTIHKVASEIVNFQKEYFDKGERYLKPLTLRQIAERIGAHESTVSRSINGKYMQCAMGVLELKYFFTSGVMACDGQGISSSSIKSMIKEIVDGENPKRPYSDLKIAEMLGNEGVEISRRTVAKYREDLQIASSSKRRRY